MTWCPQEAPAAAAATAFGQVNGNMADAQGAAGMRRCCSRGAAGVQACMLAGCGRSSWALPGGRSCCEVDGAVPEWLLGC